MSNHVLDLARGDTVVVNLGFGGNHGNRYTPSSPGTVTEYEETGPDGAQLVDARYEDVTESFDVILKAATNDLLRAALNSIEQLLREARRYARSGRGLPIYARYRPGNTGNTFRSQIMSGQVTLADAFTFYQWWNLVGEIHVTWTRRYYWEDATQATPVNAVTIYNHDDSDANHDNYVSITAANVTGVVPSPAQITLKNTLNDGVTARSFTIGHYVKRVGGSYIMPWLEGESGGSTGGAGDIQADANSSGGQYRRVALGVSEANLIHWTVTGAWLDLLQGLWYRPIARFANAPSAGLKLRWQIKSGTDVLWQSDLWDGSTATLQQLKSLQLPPDIYDVTGMQDLTLQLRGLGSGNFDLDYVQMTPIDSYRQLVNRGAGIAYNESVVDDPEAKAVYALTTTSKKIPSYYAYESSPVLLVPGHDQRLYVLAYDASGSKIARTFQVTVKYRPRRLTL